MLRVSRRGSCRRIRAEPRCVTASVAIRAATASVMPRKLITRHRVSRRVRRERASAGSGVPDRIMHLAPRERRGGAGQAALLLVARNLPGFRAPLSSAAGPRCPGGASLTPAPIRALVGAGTEARHAPPRHHRHPPAVLQLPPRSSPTMNLSWPSTPMPTAGIAENAAAIAAGAVAGQGAVLVRLSSFGASGIEAAHVLDKSGVSGPRGDAPLAARARR